MATVLADHLDRALQLATAKARLFDLCLRANDPRLGPEIFEQAVDHIITLTRVLYPPERK